MPTRTAWPLPGRTDLPDRLTPDLLPTLVLTVGDHDAPAAGVCMLEAAAWMAGERWTDRPACVAVPLATMGRGLNDVLPDDQRQALRPLLPRLLGTSGRPEVDERASLLALDWLTRTYLPTWLRLVPALTGHVDAIEATGPIVDLTTARAVGPLVRAARDAAGARGSPPGLAARDAAARDRRPGRRRRAAAWAAAGGAARDAAAWAAAWDAAWAAAWAAAGDAARDAAGGRRLGPPPWAAARAAARDAAGTPGRTGTDGRGSAGLRGRPVLADGRAVRGPAVSPIETLLMATGAVCWALTGLVAVVALALEGQRWWRYHRPGSPVRQAERALDEAQR